MCDEDNEKPFWFSTREGLAQPKPDWGPAIWLRLQRHTPPGASYDRVIRPPVLLLHGGSANHRTFTISEIGLADWLFALGLDPWLLDWRGSSLVADCPRNRMTLETKSEFYTFNRAAQEDVPAAIAIMRSQGVKGPIAAVGHCMGAAVIAETVALDWTKGAIDRIVLLTLGLFYEAPIDSRLKSEERILERLTRAVRNVPFIDPRLNEDGTLRNPWPADLNRLYDAWPSGLRAHEEKPAAGVDGMCNRVSFMYGMPFRHDNLDTSIHENASVQQDGVIGEPELAKYFGGFPLQMYLHAARNLRAGQATSFDSNGPEIVTELARQRFHNLERLTLITGQLNRLWHRDSIDRMHEWLCRGSSQTSLVARKHVLKNYAHQDLLWSKRSPLDVYPLIAEGLGLLIVADHPSRTRAATPVQAFAHLTDPESSASAR